MGCISLSFCLCPASDPCGEEEWPWGPASIQVTHPELMGRGEVPGPPRGITPFQELQGERGSLPFLVPQTLVWSPSRLILGQARGEHGIAELAEKACIHGKHQGSPWRQTAGQMQVSF